MYTNLCSVTEASTHRHTYRRVHIYIRIRTSMYLGLDPVVSFSRDPTWCYGQRQAATIKNAGEQQKHSIKCVDKLRRASKANQTATHCAWMALPSSTPISVQQNQQQQQQHQQPLAICYENLSIVFV